MAGVYRSANATAPAHSAQAITPSDSTVIPVTRAIYVGVSGNLTVVMAEEENTITFSNVPVGIFPIQVNKVLAATTAGSLVALY